MRKRDGTIREWNRRSSHRWTKEKKEKLSMWRNPSTGVRHPFISGYFIAMCLLEFAERPEGNCPQVKRTGCLNRAAAKCFARYLLAEKLLGCTISYTGQLELEEDVEGRLVDEFLGIQLVFAGHTTDLKRKNILELVFATREDGENDECYAREQGICCYGLPAPASLETRDSRIAGSSRKAK